MGSKSDKKSAVSILSAIKYKFFENCGLQESIAEKKSYTGVCQEVKTGKASKEMNDSALDIASV